MIDLVFGAGQGGARIAKQLSAAFSVEARYLNLAEIDFLHMAIPVVHSFILNYGGSGRDPVIAEKMVRKNIDNVNIFIDDALKATSARTVAICVGGGGGSGAGFLFPLIERLQKRGVRNILLLYTIPLKSEGLPARPNALITLNKIIDEYIGQKMPKDKQIAPIFIDNEFCVRRYGEGETGAGYWNRINRGIVAALRRFYNLTNIADQRSYVDMAAGFNALDYREFMRILFFKEGFIDIREIKFDIADASALGSSLKTSSLIFGSLDIGTSKAYIASLTIPSMWFNRADVNSFTRDVFDIVAKRTKTPYVLKSSYYSSRVTSAKLSILAVGLNRSHGLEKILKQTAKDVQKYKLKDNDVEKLDLSSLEM